MVRQFDFKIEFVSGISNAAADALSRFFIHGPEKEEDSELGIVLNNVSPVQEQADQAQENEDLRTLRYLSKSGTKPEKLAKGKTSDLYCYLRLFNKFSW